MKNTLLSILILFGVIIHFNNGKTIDFIWATGYVIREFGNVCYIYKKKDYSGWGKTVTIPLSSILYIEENYD